VQISSATEKSAADAVAPRAYRVTDWGGWIVLVLLAGVFLATGISIRAALHGQHPTLGDGAVIVAGGVALLWAALYYSLRVSVHAVITSEGLALVHGPWRHMIPWRDVVRLSEWTTLTDGIRYRWVALWAANGTRLQVRQDLVGDFDAFRRDLLAHLDAPILPPAAITDLDQPMRVTADLRRAINLYGIVMVVGIAGGVTMLAFLPGVFIADLVVVGIGILAFLVALGIFLFRQRIAVSREGVQARRAVFSRTIAWAAMYALERDHGTGMRGALGILGRGLVMILFRIDRRSVVVPGRDRSHSTISIRGNSGERIRIHEEHYHHPEWLRARLRAEVAALQAAAAPIAPTVQPLPKTGPLPPDAALPPDPLETSTLWLRESAEFDPFRQ
jgi:hypothetical protein